MLHKVVREVVGALPSTNMPMLPCWFRFSAVVENNKIKTINVEEDGTGLTCSLSNKIIDQLA